MRVISPRRSPDLPMSLGATSVRISKMSAQPRLRFRQSLSNDMRVAESEHVPSFVALDTGEPSEAVSEDLAVLPRA